MKKALAISGILLAAMFSAGAQTGTWSGELDVRGTPLPLVFRLEEENPTMDSPAQGAMGIPVEVERSATGAVTIRIPSIGAAYAGQWLAKQIVGTFSQSGASLPLTLVPGEKRPNRPQTTAGPFPYAREAVSFSNADADLKGTLTLPQGWNRQTPVLIMVTGSGQQNRDEEIFGHRPFAVIADAFARAGIATLRYDDRGFGESTGEVDRCTTEDLKNDALAGIGLLRERFGKVGVLGHSEGGSIALMLAAEGQADFIVCLAGAVVSNAETMLWQNRQALTAAGLPEAAVDAYCALLSEAFGACISGSAMPAADETAVPDMLKQNYRAAVVQLQTPYMRHFLAMDMRPLLGGITCPVLALNGSKDRQVEPESNLGALRAGLPATPGNRIETVEGLNHLFQHCDTGAVGEYGRIEETFAPEVLEMMTDWILALPR